MRFFLDTANIEEIKSLAALGLVDGVTTNPSIIAAAKGDFISIIQEISSIVPGPVSAEVIATEYDAMVQEGKKLSKLAHNIVVKLPLTPAGLKATKTLTLEDIKVNVTLCFSANQALLAAKCGATYISPFIGRLEDVGANGMDLVADIKQIYQNYTLPTQIIVASIRSSWHVTMAAKLGADIATLSPKIMRQMISHPLTDQGLEIFLADWQRAGKNI